MLAKEKLHGAELERKFSALLLCILLAFSWAAADAPPVRSASHKDVSTSTEAD